MDIWVLRMPERRAEPFLVTEFNEFGAKFDPNGRWVAYTSNESGRNQVYVRSFPDAADKRQISVNGGSAPRWSRDGLELFYVTADGSVIALTVDTRGSFRAGPSRLLFAADMRRAELGGQITAEAWFNVDDQRFFVVPNPPGPLPPAPPLTVITAWTGLLRK
jgi:hypothetical protein